MKLMQLRYFRQVCRSGSISRAAQVMYVAQPSVSVAIRDLEKEYGVELLERNGRSVRPTAAGKLFLEAAERLLDHADAFHGAMKELGSLREEIRLGVPPMIGAMMLPELYGLLRRKGVACSLKVSENGSKALLRQLENYEVDMVFLPRAAEGEELESFPVMQLRTMCVMASDHPLSCEKKLNVQQLKNEGLVLFDSSFYQTEQMLTRFRDAGLTPHVLLQTAQLSTIRRFVQRELAVGFLLEGAETEAPGLVSIPLDPPLPVEVHLAYRKDLHISTAKRQFLELVHRLAEESRRAETSPRTAQRT